MAVEEKTERVLTDPIERYVPPPGMTKQQLIDEYHKLYYGSAYEEGVGWQRTAWMGFPLFKMPSDLISLIDVIWQTKPALIIETGTAAGGSALFMATFLDACGMGKIVTVDIAAVNRSYPAHPRIAYLGGRSSVDPAVLAEVQTYIDYHGGPVMVILDSDHSEEHVAKELEAYHKFVTPGAYLILEDTNVGGHPVLKEHGPGPFEALEKWIPKHSEFAIDGRIPSYHLFSQHSWLKRRRT